jgi:ABC-2 type transport system ATP-binding protein
MTRPSPVLEIEHVTKVYPEDVRANDDVTIEVLAGEVFGLLGHNGAGKTTLLNQVVGIAKPTSGRIRVGGVDAVADPSSARRLCSLQPQSQAPLDGVAPRAAIELMARSRGADRHRARRRAAELLVALDIGTWADARGERLSGGVRRLTAFAMAAAEPGRLVMLDEPTNDVDPVRRRLLWAQVRALADDGCAVVLVTHNVVEAERAVGRLAILDRGRVVAHGTPAELRGDHGGELRFEVVAATSATVAELQTGLRIATGPTTVAGRRMIAPISADDCRAALDWALHEQEVGRVEEFSFNPVSLEDIYIQLVGQRRDEASAEAGDESLVA